jgi:hypothetical protein
MAKAIKHPPTAKSRPKRKAKKSNPKRVSPKPDRERLSGGEMETAPATSWQALASTYFEGRAGARPRTCRPRTKRGG